MSLESFLCNLKTNYPYIIDFSFKTLDIIIHSIIGGVTLYYMKCNKKIIEKQNKEEPELILYFYKIIKNNEYDSHLILKLENIGKECAYNIKITKKPEEVVKSLAIFPINYQVLPPKKEFDINLNYWGIKNELNRCSKIEYILSFYDKNKKEYSTKCHIDKNLLYFLGQNE